MFWGASRGQGLHPETGEEWMVCLDINLQEFGMIFEEWREAVQKAGRCRGQVEDGAEVFMRRWHDATRGQRQCDTRRLQP